ncbi:MAG: TauD/TfdA family dioxygenase [Rhodospirillaceae bacterium]|jgi:taurine dioxygenase|nr:TauD/TfdA family dioxygenase [Rhodospirillaceae bacterium]MBT5665562.1 TauD/TfdA family dioxygenase [Rhodospirillaceae bacterium]MBT5811675.1 TauD/TfdA family dioxygenase [Rhodospirillaceae bacterium]
MSGPSIEPSGGGVGAFVNGVDLNEGLSANAVSTMREALGEYGVLFLREQTITPEKHVAFAELFSKIDINRFFTPVADYPMIAEVRKEPDQKKNIGGGWHTDHSYDLDPAMGSILLARETPPKGGDTIFANMYSAYDTLSEGLKDSLSRLRGVHSSRHVFGVDAPRFKDKDNDVGSRLRNPEDATQDSIHPMVIRHPISGRKALYVNPGFTIGVDGWAEKESKALLDMLYEHAKQPEHAYRFQWAPGSIAFWDNRATWHYAVNDYHGARRLMHRITLGGEALAA